MTHIQIDTLPSNIGNDAVRITACPLDDDGECTGDEYIIDISECNDGRYELTDGAYIGGQLVGQGRGNDIGSVVDIAGECGIEVEDGEYTPDIPEYSEAGLYCTPMHDEPCYDDNHMQLHMYADAGDLRSKCEAFARAIMQCEKELL